ncbi:hypothetical protein B0H10DRAFT_2201135 [Mycena sp. CBHHK59/15]|nr:hypothetical protein B0H10DRAFT_2202854 [Mycena sp. CBHHK59/15]KAJ6560708.1 hypothetical protein B0H10DRAFT_2201135 [Mycena sp. CBHHK59/15]
MSVLVDGVWTSRVVISPFCLKPLSPLLLSRLVLGLPSLGLPRLLLLSTAAQSNLLASAYLQTAVSLGVDWITSVCKWYLDHGCELPGDAFSLRDLLYPKPVAGASTAASATPVFNGPAPNPPTPPDPVGAFTLCHIRWLLPHIRWAVSYVRGHPQHSRLVEINSTSSIANDGYEDHARTALNTGWEWAGALVR